MNIVEPTPLQLALFIIQLEKTDQNVDNISNMIKEYGRRLLDHAAKEITTQNYNVITRGGTFKSAIEIILKIKDEL